MNSTNLTLSKYQAAAARTINRELTKEEMILHALHGLVAEVGEIHSMYQKRYQGHQDSLDHLVKEGGDLMWFLAELFTAYGVDLGDVGLVNIKKLMARYPDGFETERSLVRKDGDI